jgi:hypothetical protein
MKEERRETETERTKRQRDEGKRTGGRASETRRGDEWYTARTDLADFGSISHKVNTAKLMASCSLTPPASLPASHYLSCFCLSLPLVNSRSLPLVDSCSLLLVDSRSLLLVDSRSFASLCLSSLPVSLQAALSALLSIFLGEFRPFIFLSFFWRWTLRRAAYNFDFASVV